VVCCGSVHDEQPISMPDDESSGGRAPVGREHAATALVLENDGVEEDEEGRA